MRRIRSLIAFTVVLLLALVAIAVPGGAAPPHPDQGVQRTMPKNEKYSHDATIRAGQAARAQSFTETTKTEQLHSGPPDPAEEPTENADGTAKQPARYTDIELPANPNAKGTAPAKAAAKSAPASSDLEEKTVPELKKLAADRNIEVTRGDGKDGDPLHADYVKALS